MVSVFRKGCLALAVAIVPAPACSLVVAAAADLAALQQPVAAAFPECDLRWSIGSSGMLARQIEQGADFDVYLSAHRRYVEALVRAGAADRSSAVNYARGRLAVWSAKGLGWEDLATVKHVSIANPAHAPYGAAAKQVLERQGLWEKLRDKLVYGENVRQALQFAETSNADVAITAWSLVHARGGRLVDERWHDPIVQTGVVPARARNPEGGRRLLRFLTSPAGRKLLSAHGLTPVS